MPRRPVASAERPPSSEPVAAVTSAAPAAQVPRPAPCSACLRRHRGALPVEPRRLGLRATSSTRQPSRPAPRAGRRSSSARSTRRTSSPSTSRRSSLWPMELSGRLFGFNSWSHARPAGAGGRARRLAAVRDGAALVRPGGRPARRRGCWPLTPVAVLMFRFNNPDALMTLLLVAAAYCVTRAIDDGVDRAGCCWRAARWAWPSWPRGCSRSPSCRRSRWSTLSRRRRSLRRRIAAAARAPGAALRRRRPAGGCSRSTLTPAADRPYIGGSTNNSALDLAFGYNGLGRITGNETGAGGGGGGGADVQRPGRHRAGCSTRSDGGADRVAAAGRADRARRARRAVTRRRRAPTAPAPRPDPLGRLAARHRRRAQLRRAASSTPYYTVELAPAIAALVGIGAVAAVAAARDMAGPARPWRSGVAVTGLWSYQLLHRTPTGTRGCVRRAARCALVAAAVAAAAAARTGPRRGDAAVVAALGRARRRLGGVRAGRPRRPHTGSIPSAGPASAGGGFGGARAVSAARRSGGPGGDVGGSHRRGGATERRLAGRRLPGGGFPSGGAPRAARLPGGPRRTGGTRPARGGGTRVRQLSADRAC